MSAESMLTRLHQYYKEKGISAVGFNCPHREKCSQTCVHGPMATAQEPYVGPGYEEGKLPRLLFVSSDTCDAWYKDHPEWVSLESVRECTLRRGLDGRKPNTHWYQTVDLARALLTSFAKDRLGKTLDIKKASGCLEFLAHTRTVRCKDSKGGTPEGSNRMAINCSGFLKGEIEIMLPHIIVAQGARARNALGQSFPVIRLEKMQGYPNTLYQIIQINRNHTAIKIVAKHPCAHNGSKPGNWKPGEKEQFMEWAAKSVREFIPGS